MFLQKIELIHLRSKIDEAGITMNVLVDMDDNDLKEIGIAQFGCRRKILKAAGEYKLGNINIYLM